MPTPSPTHTLIVNNKTILSNLLTFDQAMKNSHGDSEMSPEDVKISLLSLRLAVASQLEMVNALHQTMLKNNEPKKPWYKNLFRK